GRGLASCPANGSSASASAGADVPRRGAELWGARARQKGRPQRPASTSTPLWTSACLGPTASHDFPGPALQALQEKEEGLAWTRELGASPSRCKTAFSTPNLFGLKQVSNK
ncbi:hypothetical protein H1C71_006453, partial [Ictidomys tridecemlineatus]